MNAAHRADLINKLQKVVKKHFKPSAPPADRTLFEHLLYACCLENATFEAADESFAKLQQLYFDWNEVRVTTVAELAETMSSIPDASASALRLKKCLQSVFESHYSYDLEVMKKQNIGKTQQDLGKYQGVTPFTIEYVTQHALGGHSIPLNKGLLDVMVVVDLISESDAQKRHVPGLERAIPKNKGVEMASLLHQLGVEFGVHPYSNKLKQILGEIDAGAKDRLPKRLAKKDMPEDKPGESIGRTRTKMVEPINLKPVKDGKESKELGKAAESKGHADKGAEKAHPEKGHGHHEKSARDAKGRAPVEGKHSESKHSESKHSEGKHAGVKHPEGKQEDKLHREGKERREGKGKESHPEKEKKDKRAGHTEGTKKVSEAKQLAKKKPR